MWAPRRRTTLIHVLCGVVVAARGPELLLVLARARRALERALHVVALPTARCLQRVGAGGAPHWVGRTLLEEGRRAAVAIDGVALPREVRAVVARVAEVAVLPRRVVCGPGARRRSGSVYTGGERRKLLR